MPYGDHPLPPSLMGLEMGPLIGSGSFAKGRSPSEGAESWRCVLVLGVRVASCAGTTGPRA